MLLLYWIVFHSIPEQAILNGKNNSLWAALEDFLFPFKTESLVF